MVDPDRKETTKPGNQGLTGFQVRSLCDFCDLFKGFSGCSMAFLGLFYGFSRVFHGFLKVFLGFPYVMARVSRVSKASLGFSKDFLSILRPPGTQPPALLPVAPLAPAARAAPKHRQRGLVPRLEPWPSPYFWKPANFW